MNKLIQLNYIYKYCYIIPFGNSMFIIRKLFLDPKTCIILSRDYDLYKLLGTEKPLIYIEDDSLYYKSDYFQDYFNILVKQRQAIVLKINKHE